MKTCYHIHSNYSDGKNTIEQIVKAAIENEFKRIALTDHAPVPFPSDWNMPYDLLTKYLAHIERIQEEFQNNILILRGLEIDYLTGLRQIAFFKNFGLDITVGSVHYVNYFVDGTPFNIDKSKEIFLKGLKQIYNNDIKKFAYDYYSLIIEMVMFDPPDIVAHLTLIEKFNKSLNYLLNTKENWYRDLIYTALHTIKVANLVLEINTRSFYRGLSDEFVPDLWTLKNAKKMNIPITINGDIHCTDDFGKYWKQAIEFIKAAGYSEIIIFDVNGSRQTIKID